MVVVARTGTTVPSPPLLKTMFSGVMLMVPVLWL